MSVSEFRPKAKTQIASLPEMAADADFVRACEQSYEKEVKRAAGQIAESGRKIVMLTGPSASGKTTTAKKLAAALTEMGRSASVISLDDFYVDAERYPTLPDGRPDYESLWALDVELINDCLSEVAEKGSTWLPHFSFIERKSYKNHRELTLGDDGCIIVEGIHAFNPELVKKVSAEDLLLVYAGLRSEYYEGGHRVIATRDMRIVRRMIRDARERGHDPEATLKQWSEILKGDKNWIQPFKPRANILINTSLGYEPCLYAPLLEEIAADENAGGSERETLLRLRDMFAACPGIGCDGIPQNSLVREFIGGLEL